MEVEVQERGSKHEDMRIYGCVGDETGVSDNGLVGGDVGDTASGV